MADVTIGDLSQAQNPGDDDLFEVEQNGVSLKMTFAQIKEAISQGSLQDIAGLIQEGDNVSITGSGTEADPFVINAAAGGDGIPEAPEDGKLYGRKDKEWEVVDALNIDDMPDGLPLSGDDLIPMSQTALLAAPFWRLSIRENTLGSAEWDQNRVYEVQFREYPGVPQSKGSAQAFGQNTNELGPPENAFDENTSTPARKDDNTGPYTVSLEYAAPLTVREVAVFYPANVTNRNFSPGSFDIEYSLNGTDWVTHTVVEGFAPANDGWHTFALNDETSTRKVPLSKVAEFAGGGSGGGVPEAPLDGRLYGRKDGGWEEVETGGGGGGDFEIDDLPAAADASTEDFVPLSQRVAARFWRIRVIGNSLGEPDAVANRLYEIEFRGEPGVPEGKGDAEIVQEGTSVNFTADNALDGDLETYARAALSSTPMGVGLEYSTARTVREVAIYYPEDPEGLEFSPGLFNVEFSHDGSDWTPLLFVEGFLPGEAGWHTFAVPESRVQRRATLEQVAEAMGGTGGVPEAPVDGKLYGRKDEGWEEVPEAEGFDISGLPVAATLLNSDYLPVSQSAAPSVRFWRLTVLSNTENNTYGLTNRLYEMQLREIVGIPQTAEPATVTGTRWYSNYPVGNAVDGDTSTYAAGSQMNHPPYTVRFEYPEPVAILELAIFYPSASSGRLYSPGNFRVEYSEDGTIWNTALDVSGYSSPPEGWNTWELFGDAVQRRAHLQQLAAFLDTQIGDLPAGDNPGDGDLFEVEQGGQSKRLTFAQIKAAATGETTLPVGAHPHWRIFIEDVGPSDSAIVDELRFRKDEADLPLDGAPSASREGHVNNPASAAFDGTPSVWSTGSSAGALPAWLAYSFSEPVEVDEISLKAGDTQARADGAPTVFLVEFSDDGENWTSVQSYTTSPWAVDETRLFGVPASYPVSYVPEAPEEGIGFVRKDKGWVPEKTVAALDPSAALSETDRLALSQAGYASGEYWRVLVHTSAEGGSGSGDIRISELQFREQEGVPQSRVDETIRGYNTSSYYPAADAFDGSLTSNTRNAVAGVPLGVGLSRSVPWTVREIAINYRSAVNLGLKGPGTFDIQVSSDGENWATVASIGGFVPPASGWYTFSTASPAVERSASLQQIREFMGPEAATPQQIRDGAEPLFVATDALRDSKLFREVTAGSADTTLPLDEHINIDLIVSTDTTVDTVGQPAQAGKGVNVLLRGDSPTAHTVTWGSNVLNVDPPVIDNLTDTLGWIVSGIVSPDGRFMITSANEVNL